MDGAPLYATTKPEQALANIAAVPGDAIFLLKDFARYCSDDKICRMLRDLADAFRSARRSIVMSAPSLNLPPETCERLGAVCVWFAGRGGIGDGREAGAGGNEP